jgi:CelD/BcsL family acetyltransferase involved in cellulose biosynthesis
MDIHVEAHRDPEVFDVLADEWTALLHRSACDTPFLSPVFQRTWWRHLGEGELLLLTAREGRDLVGVAPLFAVDEPAGGRVLHTVGCVEVSDYLDWVAAPGLEEEVLGALLAFLDGVDDWARLDLCNVHQDSPTLRLLPALAQARGWAAQTEVQDVCPVVSLPGTWEEYLASLGRKHRHELRRKLRRAEATQGLRWFVVGPEGDLDQAAADLFDLMEKSSPEKAEFLTPAMRGFFHELIRATFASHWLQLAFLDLGGTKLAAYLNWVYGNRVLSYNSGLDWQSDPGLGAGVVLTGFLIRDAIAEGREVYDFLRGDERYKYRFGGQDVTVNRVLIAREA